MGRWRNSDEYSKRPGGEKKRNKQIEIALKNNCFYNISITFFSVNTAVYVADQYATKICVGFSDRI